VIAKVVNQAAGEGLAESRPDADGGGDRSERQIEAARPSRKIGDDEHGHNAEDPTPV
jgi:hypothetical protein